ncbi:MAG: hypothetical protein COT43_02515 [Candidatus Marinimicrobia bacterium CG08_land_8_20_14_0_20_45_22]|nr:MAG: hypothetical protein COT43_02515 [Candidatus Marinimicrobia bacterium CG08_land_8_20_14_0_20_45_22]
MKNETEIRQPFVYLARPDGFLPFLKTIDAQMDLAKWIDQIDLHAELTPDDRQKIELFGDSTFWSGISDPSDFQMILETLKSYRHWTREVSASLKFNLLKQDKTGQKMRRELMSLLQQFADRIHPCAVFRKVTARRSKTGISILGFGLEFISRRLHHFLSDDQPFPLVCYVVSIGPEIEEVVRDFSTGGDVFQTYLLNGLGSGAADLVAYNLQKYIEHPNGSRLKRLSPGFHDWALTDQLVIFQLLKPESTIGVRLTDACLMHPLKSTSGIMLPLDKLSVTSSNFTHHF